MNTQEKQTELKKYLKEAGLKQESLAELFGVSQANIGALLNGKTKFGKRVAAEWEKKLNIRAAWLMLGDGEMLRPSITQTGKNNVHMSGGSGNIAVAGSQTGNIGYQKDPFGLGDQEEIERLKKLVEALEAEKKELWQDNRALIERVNYLTDRLLEK